MSDNHGLTEEAIELIKNCPYIINKLAKHIQDAFGVVVFSDTITEPLEPIEISAVTYSPAECGYEK